MRIAVKKNPVDLDQNIRVGISIPFNGKSVFNSTYSSAEQLRSNLINLLLTDKGERFFDIEFGVGLRSMLFQNIDNDLDFYENSIKEEIIKNISNIIIHELVLTPQEDNYINLYIKYSSNTDMKTDVVNITF